ncbi:MAG: glycosyltransferase family 2 protein [Methanobacteriota archaeon]|nr:MAG: glycosyltransferase family 2 protein [Euryarchaeota archaeon]
MDISVIVPVYNEEATISEILKRLLDLEFPGSEKEVIVVDDGSTDRTPELLEEFRGEPGLKVITHKENRGKGAALRTGIESARGRVIAFQDSDLEYAPEELPHLVRPVLDGEEDVVYGSRFLGSVEKMSLLFYIGNRALTLLTGLLYRASITDMETGFKVFREEVIRGLELESQGFDIEPEITAKLLKKGYHIKEIPVNYVAREKTEKKITVKDGLSAALALIKYRFR